VSLDIWACVPQMRNNILEVYLLFAKDADLGMGDRRSVVSSQRDSSVDLMRIFMMLLICLIHSVSRENLRYGHWLSNIACVGVVVFVLISGYYGIRFTPSKVIRLEAMGLACAFTASFIGRIFGVCGFSDGLDYFLHYWFLHAYVVMMAFAALVDKRLRLDTIDGGRSVLPILVVVFGWSFISQVPIVQRFVPRSEGLDAFSGITLFAIYIIGWFYRVYSLDSRLKWRWVLPIMCLSVICASQFFWPLSRMQMVFSRYNSPVLLVFAVCVFWLFRRMHIPRSSVGLLAFITPSVFAVYLIHCNPVGYRAFDALERMWAANGLNVYLAYMVNAVTMFIVALLVDIPRRCIIHLLKSRIIRVNGVVDGTFEKLCRIT